MIKYILFIVVLLSLNINAQSVNDDYKLLDEVISNNFEKVINLNANSDFILEDIKDYYNFKYLKKKKGRIIGYKYDKNNKRIPNYYTDKVQEKFRIKWYSKYDTLSKLFTKKDFEILIKKNNSKWEKDNLINNKAKIKDLRKQSHEFVFISKPYYSIDGKYALIQYSKEKYNSFTVIYKKDKEIWILNNVIENNL
jgi:hypothetical protein